MSKRRQAEADAKQARLARLSRLDGEEVISNRPLTREEQRLTGRGRYELDANTRKLTSAGKTARLKHRLNVAIIVMVILIVITYLILFLA
jgi:hypothetical protein